MMADVNPKLLETSRYGMIPTMADGLKPFRAYAAGSDAERARAAKTPSIAIVITGLGVGAAKTTEAILKLPGAVTLAFTPYGAEPAKLVARARAQKHEVLLQVPMEPFDYPDNDPGPQTLLTSLGRRPEYRSSDVAHEPVPGLCRHRELHGIAPARERYRDEADYSGRRQARTRLS